MADKDQKTVVGGKDVNTSKTDGKEVREAWGQGVARAAIREIKGTEGPESEVPASFDEAEVQAFLTECETNKLDPYEVIEHIATREGIDVGGDKPEDAAKAKIWLFLRDVVSAVVKAAAVAALKSIANGAEWCPTIIEFLGKAMGRDGKEILADMTDDEDDDAKTSDDGKCDGEVSEEARRREASCRTRKNQCRCTRNVNNTYAFAIPRGFVLYRRIYGL